MATHPKEDRLIEPVGWQRPVAAELPDVLSVAVPQVNGACVSLDADGLASHEMEDEDLPALVPDAEDYWTPAQHRLRCRFGRASIGRYSAGFFDACPDAQASAN